MADRDFLKSGFGIEIEMTGMTRAEAAATIAEHLSGSITWVADNYDTRKITAPDGRVWKVVFDSSINAQRRFEGRKIAADADYKVELVSPILHYDEDIETLQEMVRKLRKAGAFSERENCTGIHIHLDGAPHSARSLRNLVNIVYSRNDLLYESLQIAPERMRYCKKLDETLAKRMAQVKPTTMQQVEDIWYEGYSGSRQSHYHRSRYQFANLHSLFNGVGTVELRGFNSTLHAGEIRAYLVLALALNYQALTQKNASAKKPQTDNPKFAMRTWLNRIGFIGKEFQNCRKHLTKHLRGSAGWRFRQTA